jgi:hypothetical protein
MALAAYSAEVAPATKAGKEGHFFSIFEGLYFAILKI